MFKRDLQDTMLTFLGAASIAIAIILILWVLSSLTNPNNCTTSTYECRKTQLQLCLKDEQYTLDQCLSLIGSNNK